MEIIKAFENNDLNMHVTIRGTHEEPLFRASDIGSILDMTNIRQTIKDFDHTEKCGVSITDIIGRDQETTFLTEKGLYQVLFTSRKPIAKKFKDWVCEVIKEIRLTGRYELEQKIEDFSKQLTLKDKQIENTLILNFRNKQIVYLIYVEKNVIKFGYAKDIEERIKQHRTEFGKDIILHAVFETIYNREFETMIKQDSVLFSHIISKKYKKNQTELIQLNNTFTIHDLDKRIEELKKIVNGDLVSNLIKEKQELQLELATVKSTKNCVKYIRTSAKIDYPIISYNLVTEEETEFDTLSKICYYYDISSSTVKNYLDQHKQINGTILRSGKNKPYWILPANFKFCNIIKPTTHNIFIKRVDKTTNEITYYNSITEASLYLQQEIDKKEIIEETTESIALRKILNSFLNGHPTKKPIIIKYDWHKMKDIGFIKHIDGSLENIDNAEKFVKLNKDER